VDELGICHLTDTVLGRSDCQSQEPTAKPPQHFLLTTFSKRRVYDVGLAGKFGAKFAPVSVESKTDHGMGGWSNAVSYQIEDSFLSSEYCCLTNIHTDHLDRYDYKFEKLLNSKAATFSKTWASNNCLIVKLMIPILFKVLPQLRLELTKHWFSPKRKAKV